MEKIMPDTISFYNENPIAFISQTVNADMTEPQNKFLSYIPMDSTILDFGCGSGRDTKAFLEKGYQVEAVDGSEELCKYASEYTGILVKHMYFQDLIETEKYDGIWACASILHLKKTELIGVFSKMAAALKTNGIIYTSFKYGTFEGERNDRYFTDMTEQSIEELLQEIPNLQIKEQWITKDVRPDRENEQWLNLILRKK